MSIWKQWVAAACEYVFPERPDHALVRTASVTEFCALLAPHQYDNFTALLPFREPLVKAAIHEAKFHHNEAAWELLAGALALYARHCQNGTILVPVPLARRRQRERGYNQVQAVATLAVPAAPQITLQPNLLRRIRHTEPQTSLKRQDRLTNVAGAFAAANGEWLAGKPVIILDDVATTGATLAAAAAALQPFHPASITQLALAH